MRVPGLSARKRIEELQNENTRLREDITGLRRDITERDREIERLRRERDRLKEERDRVKDELETAKRTGKRQAAPFSKGEPKAEPKKPGRKPGHAYGPKRHRDIPSQVDEELDAHLPDKCPKCGGEIGHERVEDQYQEEVVRKTHRTKFRVHVGSCLDCGTRVQGRHPRQTSDAIGAAASQVGPDALALATVLNKGLGLSHGQTVAVLQKGFGLTLTPGGLNQALARIGERCEPTYEGLKQYVRTSPSVTMDETGWQIGGRSAWLHVATTAEVTVYGIFRGRGFEEAAALIGADYNGDLVRDGWAPYRRFELAFHQSCTRHLINRCDEMILRRPLERCFRCRSRTSCRRGFGSGTATPKVPSRITAWRSRLADSKRSWIDCWTDRTDCQRIAGW